MRSSALLIASLAAGLGACGGAPAPTSTPQIVTKAQPGLEAAPPPIDTTFLDQYAATFRFRLGHPSGVKVTDDGQVLFLRSGARSFSRVLYHVDPQSGAVAERLTGKGLLAGEAETMTAEEKARRERMRLAARGIARFSLVEPAGKLLIPLSGRRFVYDPATNKTVFATAEGGVQDARLSPDGSHLALVRGGDLHLVDVATGKRRQLTSVASKTVTAGLPEFVAQEELGRYDGMWFSPDGAQLLWQQTDTAGMEQFHILDPKNPSKVHASPYPRPGGKNADVRLFVSPVKGKGAAKALDWDRAKYPYLVHAVWPKKAPLTLVVMNRRQSEVAVLTADPKAGTTTVLHTETDAAWVNTDNRVPRWLPDGSGFLWTTERGGAWRLELRDAQGKKVRDITPAGFAFDGLIKVDAKAGLLWVYGAADPTQRHVFRVPLAGGEPVQITQQTGWHALYTGGKTRRAVHMVAPLDGMTSWSVRELTDEGLGPVQATLPTVAESAPFVAKPEFRTVTLEGRTHHAVVVRPRAFDAHKKYPVIVSVYGGPHYSAVRKVGRRLVFEQWLADQGFIVIKADGRGTPRRGRDWERAIRGDFITKPLADQVGVLQALGKALPEMDLDRVGIYGWSFGGYFSAMATMQRPDVFDCGIAGAPVTDWRDYDTGYTERYLGLPDTEKAAYDVSSVLTYADKLAKPLMIVHGTGDDNVYFVHALKMSDALFRANKPHDLMVLAGHSHMVADAAATRSLYTRFVEFFRRNLGAPAAR